MTVKTTEYTVLDTAPFNTYMFHVLCNCTVLSKMSGKCHQNTWTYAY